MIKKILLVLGLVIIAFLIFAATRPDDFSVTRSTTIAAPPATVFAQVNDFHKWVAWSPWEKMDPELKRIYEGPAAGTGAIYKWSGNSKVGEGKMTITESRPSDLVKLKLEFIKPFAATNDTEFTFKPEGDKTVVTWTMSGKNNFMFKAMQVFMSMDKMVGKDFEAGLAAMKAVAEAPPKTELPLPKSDPPAP
jgi:hypothetical protein